ncbi:MAG: ANTAR domain-containing protein [Streptosporangiaceae bacterium]
MPGRDLADRTAALLTLAATTEERSVSQLACLAASQVTGCAAACVALWRDGELVREAASHPDPSRLLTVQLQAGRGPDLAAVTDSNPVSCPDMLTETRWPEYAAASLRLGIRSSVALGYHGPVVITLSLFGVWPGAVDHRQLQLAELLVAYGSGLVGAVSEFGDSRRTAVQLRDAAGSRAVVDQAKGILMHALGCTADEALAKMRAVSQRSNLRATEVAQRVLDAYDGRPGRLPREALGQLAGLAPAARKRKQVPRGDSMAP